jgi:hypothetical protein
MKAHPLRPSGLNLLRIDARKLPRILCGNDRVRPPSLYSASATVGSRDRGTSAAAHMRLPRDGRARSSRLVQVRGPATFQGGSQREVKARRQLSQIVAKLTNPGAELAQSTGAVRPQRGQTHSVTGSPRDPLRPGCACCPAQRVRSRIGPWPRGQALGSTVSSGRSAKAAPSYGTPPPMCFGQDLLP